VTLSKEPLKKKVDFKGIGSDFVLSPAINFIVARNDIGVILAYGKDYALGRRSKAWAYQGERFFGFFMARDKDHSSAE
jgi:hypothetical protein